MVAADHPNNITTTSNKTTVKFCLKLNNLDFENWNPFQLPVTQNNYKRFNFVNVLTVYRE